MVGGGKWLLGKTIKTAGVGKENGKGESKKVKNDLKQLKTQL